MKPYVAKIASVKVVVVAGLWRRVCGKRGWWVFFKCGTTATRSSSGRAGKLLVTAREAWPRPTKFREASVPGILAGYLIAITVKAT